MENDARDELHEKLNVLFKSIPKTQSEAVAFLSQLCEQWEQKGTDFLLELKNSLSYFQALVQILKAINNESDIGQLLSLILDKAIELTCAERGFLLLRDLEVARHFDGENIVGEYKISRSIANKVQRTGQPIVIEDAQNDERFSQYQSIKKYHARSVLCLPIMVKGNTLGVLYLDNRLISGKFHASHLNLMAAFAEQAAIAMENSRLCSELTFHTHKIQLLNVKLQRQLRNPQEAAIVHEELQKLDYSYQYHHLFGRSAKMNGIFCLIEKIKDYDIPVLILGDSGTGKELAARAIHESSRFHDRVFISENCAAIPETLCESELFGHEKGAFTGASQTKKGLFEQAHNGTLFLDEIGELPMEMQKKLLRVLAEKVLRRVGGHDPISFNVRIITATNRDIKQMIAAGQFREDLFYRLNGVSFTLPPLRERREDIPLLAEQFLKEPDLLYEGHPKKMERGLMSILISYDWPGNVRQLRNEIHRLAALSGPILEAQYLSPEILPPSSKRTPMQEDKIHNLPQFLQEVEKKEILKALEYCNHNKSRASQRLGISRFTLQRKMEKYGLE